jgi:hypothetical protein
VHAVNFRITRRSAIKLTVSVLTVVILGFGAGVVGAADPMAGKEATPTIGELLTKDTVKGTLMRVDGENYWVRDTDGKEVRLHVATRGTRERVITRVARQSSRNGECFSLVQTGWRRGRDLKPLMISRL